MKQIAFLLLSFTLLYQQSNGQRIRKDKIIDHVSFLASDALLGRATSSEDEGKAAAYIADAFKRMDIAPKGNRGYFHYFTYKKSNQNDPHGTTESSTGVTMKSKNVVGFIDNGAPYTVVIGAHYDHLGLGHDHNSLDANPEGKIHNGADDNASGVAGLLELARYFRSNGIKEKNNFLFIAFSGEELGLLGSKKWCEYPSYPLKKINYMINLDMIGRLNDKTKKLLVYGVGTSDVWIPTLEKINTFFTFKYDSSGVGPSDHTSFYLKDIPVLHYFTGQHSDYHKPTDDLDKVNAQGEVYVLEHIIDLIYALDTESKLHFYKTKSVDTKMSFKVTLGIMPDYAYDGKGVHLDGVTENKPAHRAGLEKGDVILKLGSFETLTMQDYMKALGQFEKGETTTVEYLRDNAIHYASVTF
ncbi:MAG: M20/M25/M40 family metallo-hydrolase [Chitinophagaceae bacterium]